MKRNYISIVTISALFYQLLIAPLSAMTDCAVQDTGMRNRIAVVTSVPVDTQNVFPFSPANKQDLENKRIAEENYAFETKVMWIATLLFVVGLVVSLFYPLKTFLSSFDEAITGSTSYSPFAFFAQQDMHAQFNATTTIPYLKDHFQNNTQMQNTLVEAACHYIKKGVLPSNITDAFVGYADFFMGSFKYISVIQQVVAFTLCFNPVTNMTSALNVVKGSIYGIAYNLQPPVCENPDDLGVAFNIMKRKPELAAEYPSVNGAYKLAVGKPKMPDLLMNNHYGTARREFVAQSAEDVHDLIQDSPYIPNLIFNLTQQMRSHICPADIMMARLTNDAFRVLSSVIVPSNYTFFYFWFNRHGALVRTNYSTDGALGNISSSACDWQSDVKFGNDAHVRIALNAYGRMWITNQQLDFLPDTPTIEKTHTRKLSLSKELAHTDTLKKSASEALAGTNTTEQSVSSELPGTNTTEQSVSDSSERSLSQITGIDTFTQSKTLAALRWLANLTGLENSSQQYSWTQMIPNGAVGSPPARYGHAAGRMGDEMFIGFGLNESGSFLADTWVLNLTSFVWRNLGASISARGRAPGTVTYNDSTWVFGGDGSADTLTRFSQEGYQTFATTGYLLSGWAAMTRIGNNFYLFGGRNSGNSTNQLYRMQSTSSVWQNITSSPSPVSREKCQFAVVNQDAYIFGGFLTSGLYENDVWKFSPASGWEEMSPGGLSGIPIVRYSYMMGVINTDILIFGGGAYASVTNGSGVTDDLWKLDTQLMRWNLIMANGQAGSPSRRKDAGTDFVNFNNDLYMFGGNNGSDNCYNDLWRLRQTKVRLYDVKVSPNPILFNQNFTLSWTANVSSGATGHLANITFNGRKYAQTFDGALGSIILMANGTLGNSFSIPLSVQDLLDPLISTNLNIPFEIDDN